MIRVTRRRSRSRRGAIAVLGALLMVVVLGMVAFAVDLGYIAATQSELQNAADAAALAGAGPLMNGYITYNLPSTASQQTAAVSSAEATAKSYAKTYAQNNSAGGVSSLTLLDADIQFGYMDNNNNYTAAGSSGTVTITGTTYFPNTINVTMRRDGNANGSLALFFANVFGTNSINLTATASATIYGGTVNTLAPMRVLPMTYDVNAWNNFLATGQSPDGGTTTDSSGNATIQVYPSTSDSGNFGELSLDGSHTGASTTAGWINNGISSSDVSALQSAGLIPLSSTPSWDWIGNPGLKASNIMDVNDYVGTNMLMPLFNPYNSNPSDYAAGTGQGANYFYNIVQFVGVTIEQPSSDNSQIIVQPAAMTVPASLLTNLVPAGSNGTALITTFAPPKLTR